MPKFSKSQFEALSTFVKAIIRINRSRTGLVIVCSIQSVLCTFCICMTSSSIAVKFPRAQKGLHACMHTPPYYFLQPVTNRSACAYPQQISVSLKTVSAVRCWHALHLRSFGHASPQAQKLHSCVAVPWTQGSKPRMMPSRSASFQPFLQSKPPSPSVHQI